MASNGDHPNGDTSNGDQKPKRGRGRPASHQLPIGENDLGELVTAATRIPELIRVGMYLEPACAAAGIRPHAAYEWMRIGAMAFYKRHTATQMGVPHTLSEHELVCLDFNQAVVRAESEWEQEQNVLLSQLGRGGLRTTKTTIKRGPPTRTIQRVINQATGETRTEPDLESGPIIEATTVTEVLPPNPQVIQWRLTRRFMERYGNRIEVTPTKDATELSDVDHAEQLIDQLEQFLSGGSNGD